MSKPMFWENVIRLLSAEFAQRFVVEKDLCTDLKTKGSQIEIFIQNVIDVYCERSLCHVQ